MMVIMRLSQTIELYGVFHPFTVKDEVPYDWKVQTSEWNVEDSGKWKTEDTDKFFYGIEEKND